MLTEDQKLEIKLCIAFYENRGYDWSDVVEYLIRKYNKTLSWQVRRTHENIPQCITDAEISRSL